MLRAPRLLRPTIFSGPRPQLDAPTPRRPTYTLARSCSGAARARRPSTMAGAREGALVYDLDAPAFAEDGFRISSFKARGRCTARAAPRPAAPRRRRCVCCAAPPAAPAVPRPAAPTPLRAHAPRAQVKRCPRAKPHDWVQCPFAHPGALPRRAAPACPSRASRARPRPAAARRRPRAPTATIAGPSPGAGEKAKRRDPHRFKYSGTACPEYRRVGLEDRSQGWAGQRQGAWRAPRRGRRAEACGRRRRAASDGRAPRVPPTPPPGGAACCLAPRTARAGAATRAPLPTACLSAGCTPAATAHRQAGAAGWGSRARCRGCCAACTPCRAASASTPPPPPTPSAL
jgi:hypothetical protein